MDLQNYEVDNEDLQRCVIEIIPIIIKSGIIIEDFSVDNENNIVTASLKFSNIKYLDENAEGDEETYVYVRDKQIEALNESKHSDKFTWDNDKVTLTV